MSKREKYFKIILILKMGARLTGLIHIFTGMFFVINHSADVFSSEVQSVLFQHEDKA